MLYRLVYKNGRHGAWSKDFNQVQDMAKLFNAKIETKTEMSADEKVRRLIEILDGNKN